MKNMDDGQEPQTSQSRLGAEQFQSCDPLVFSNWSHADAQPSAILPSVGNGERLEIAEHLIAPDLRLLVRIRTYERG